ncbi:MAG: hypothetical protein WC832_07520 [Anaerolineales bacterium]
MEQLALALLAAPLTVLELDPTTIRFEQPPSLQDLLDGYEKLNGDKRPRKKVILAFKQPVSIPVVGRQFKTVSTVKAHFFASAEKRICYATRDGFSRGYWGHYIPLDQVQSMSIEADEDGIKEALALAARIYPGAWEDVKKRIEDDPATWLKEHGKPKYISMASVFSQHVCDAIKTAFETKGRYHYSLPGTKRDRSVEMHLCDSDGLYRAWYSSEYSGCGNGAYYLLINPTTAVFCEND